MLPAGLRIGLFLVATTSLARAEEATLVLSDTDASVQLKHDSAEYPGQLQCDGQIRSPGFVCPSIGELCAKNAAMELEIAALRADVQALKGGATFSPSPPPIAPGGLEIPSDVADALGVDRIFHAGATIALDPPSAVRSGTAIQSFPITNTFNVALSFRVHMWGGGGGGYSVGTYTSRCSSSAAAREAGLRASPCRPNHCRRCSSNHLIPRHSSK